MDSIWNNLFERYYKSWNGIEAAYDKIAASYGVTSNVMNILTLLCKNREPMTQNELSQELYLSRQTITSVVDSLERQGLVTRSISEKDRRSRVVCLTDEGRSFGRKLGRAMRKMEMLSGCSPQKSCGPLCTAWKSCPRDWTTFWKTGSLVFASAAVNIDSVSVERASFVRMGADLFL